MAAGEKSWKCLLITAEESELRGDNLEARKLFQTAVTCAEQEPGAQPEEVALALMHLADHSAACGRLEEAELLYRRTIVIYEQEFGREHLATCLAMRALAETCRTLGKLDEARDLDNTRRAIMRRITLK